MPKVIYELPNAPDEIDGVKFTPHPDGAGVVSEEISEEAAQRLATIPGFKLVGSKPAPSPTPAPSPAPTPAPSPAPTPAPSPAPTPAPSPAPETVESPRAIELKKLTVKELKALAETHKIAAVKGWKEADYVAAIIAAELAAQEAGSGSTEGAAPAGSTDIAPATGDAAAKPAESKPGASSDPEVF